MYFKWIECNVLKEKEEDFTMSQTKWKLLSPVSGFIAQFGGYEHTNNMLKAHIFGIWRDRESYDRFMDKVHDEIFKQTQQYGTYESIEICFGELKVRNEVIAFESIDKMLLVLESNIAFYEFYTAESLVSRGEISMLHFLDNRSLHIELVPSWNIVGNY